MRYFRVSRPALIVNGGVVPNMHGAYFRCHHRDCLLNFVQFDTNGNTGGCQGMYTMIANNTATPSCNNVTFPLGPLDVDAAVSSGPLSQYGWVDQVPDNTYIPPIAVFSCILAVLGYTSDSQEWNPALHLHGEPFEYNQSMSPC